MKRVLILLGAGLVLLAGAVLYVAVSFEIEATPRGSLLYRTGIPRALKDLPVMAACDRPLYSYYGQDGERLPYGALRYDSSAGRAAIFAGTEAALAERGCTADTRQDDWFDMTCGRYTRFVIGVTAGDPCDTVTIEMIGEQPWP